MSFEDRIYNYDSRNSHNLSRIKNSDIDESNKKELLGFYQECVIRGLSKARIVKYLNVSQRLAE